MFKEISLDVRIDTGGRQHGVRAVTPDAEDIRETNLNALRAREIDT